MRRAAKMVRYYYVVVKARQQSHHNRVTMSNDYLPLTYYGDVT